VTRPPLRPRTKTWPAHGEGQGIEGAPGLRFF
jgi:hypothetical protein